MMTDDADHWNTVIDPPQNSQTEADSSDDRAKENNSSAGQTSLKIMSNKQTSEYVK